MEIPPFDDMNTERFAVAFIATVPPILYSAVFYGILSLVNRLRTKSSGARRQPSTDDRRGPMRFS